MDSVDTFLADITEFDPKTASREDWVALNVFRNLMRAERHPDDPPETLEKTIASGSNFPAFATVRAWVARIPGNSQIIAAAAVYHFDTEDNRHLAEFAIEVLPEFRRRSLGSRLLALPAGEARDASRTMLIAESNERIPAGGAFMERIGARVGLETHTNQLDVADLNRDLLEKWLEAARERAADFSLGLWAGPVPESDIEAYAELTGAMNFAPRGDLEVEDFRTTPEQIRQREETNAARKTERWIMYVRHEPTGELAGFTEVFWNPEDALLLWQGDTAVWPKYRNLGLGRWLKAAMLEKVVKDRPQVKYVRTGNADSNAAMLKINYELGFKPYLSESVWQVELDRVFEYLGQALERATGRHNK